MDVQDDPSRAGNQGRQFPVKGVVADRNPKLLRYDAPGDTSCDRETDCRQRDVDVLFRNADGVEDGRKGDKGSVRDF